MSMDDFMLMEPDDYVFWGHQTSEEKGKAMQPFQERVVEEKKELDDKLFKLKAFLNNPIFPTLPEAERQRLEKQSLIMQQYSDILGERIAAFQ